MQGGGWCLSEKDCLSRSKGDLGTSKQYTKDKTAEEMEGQSGAMVRNSTTNPQMHDWNHVWIKYCDGNSFTGANASTTKASDGSTLFWRGSLILDAAIESLLANPLSPLSAATDVVVGGGSAGGLATFIHCVRPPHLAPSIPVLSNRAPRRQDRWAQHFTPSKTHYVCLADSGFFLDYDGPPKYGDGMRWAYQQQNSSAGVQRECLAHYEPSGEGWRCNFAQYTASFAKAPLFARQSTYDAWQSGNILGSKAPGPMNAFGANLTRLIEGSLLRQKQHAVFLDSCFHHCALWDQIRIDGQLVHQAFWAWYNGSSAEAKLEQRKPYPCAECCKPDRDHAASARRQLRLKTTDRRASEARPLWLDAAQGVEARLAALLPTLSVEQLAAQTEHLWTTVSMAKLLATYNKTGAGASYIAHPTGNATCDSDPPCNLEARLKANRALMASCGIP